MPTNHRVSDYEEEVLHDDDEENETLSSYAALDDVIASEAAELGPIARLADTWDCDLDLEVSAQLVQGNVQAYLSVGKEKGKGKGKGRYPGRPSHLSLEDRRRRLKELKAKTECRACGRKGHWANDRECAMSSSSSSTQNQARTARMATRQRLHNQESQKGICFVLNEYSDDPDTSAYMVGQNVPLPTEKDRTESLTPAASATTDIKNTATFSDRAMEDNDETWATEAVHRTC